MLASKSYISSLPSPARGHNKYDSCQSFWLPGLRAGLPGQDLRWLAASPGRVPRHQSCCLHIRASLTLWAGSKDARSSSLMHVLDPGPRCVHAGTRLLAAWASACHSLPHAVRQQPGRQLALTSSDSKHQRPDRRPGPTQNGCAAGLQLQRWAPLQGAAHEDAAVSAAGEVQAVLKRGAVHGVHRADVRLQGSSYAASQLQPLLGSQGLQQAPGRLSSA